MRQCGFDFQHDLLKLTYPGLNKQYGTLASENETDEDDGNSSDEKEAISYHFNAGHEDILLFLEKHNGYNISIRTLKHRLSDTISLHRNIHIMDD